MHKLTSRLSGCLSGPILAFAAARAALFPADPPYLIFFVTHRCNLNCSFCFDRSARESSSADDELSLAEIEKIASRWRRPLQVTLTGGEPTLRHDLADIALAFVRAGAKSLTIDTNGWLTERVIETAETVLAAAPGLSLDVNVSIDGPAEVHDRLRGVKGAHGRAMAAARGLAPLHDFYPGFRAGATLTVCAGNRESAADTVTELLDSGVFRRVQALLVRGAVDESQKEGAFEAYEQCRRILDASRVSRGPGRLKERLSARARDTVSRAARGLPTPPCLAGETMVTVEPAGRVLPCEMPPPSKPGGAAGIDGWTMGELSQSGYEIAGVMKSEKARRVVKWIRENECRCTFECAAYNALVFNPRSWPGVLFGK